MGTESDKFQNPFVHRVYLESDTFMKIDPEIVRKIDFIYSHLQGQGDSNAQPAQDRDYGERIVMPRNTGEFLCSCGVHYVLTPNSDKGDRT